MDLAVEYHGNWDIIEVKLLRRGKSREALVAEGKKQVLRYRDRFSPAKGKAVACYLVIFDRRAERGSWEERLLWTKDGDVTVIGC
jgi:hypothetical protein